ncbi:aspartate/tyrosine/aromatic aminotransferase [Candidatus Nitrososphaera evergladensis SR1]|uniref:Aminotransferase n=1 Tax=Candidatus Nitrososphaera evergladensis SR1 TaxID=1459636 RepID=A0A075MS68_9ARCH|nr:aminotransferase class I/II-fold pyridoxal phosphate-dependent enzyme [Candidatus Nitrososphaera evergladensis]AIF84008.1 aspartate/tyrosine/aromatic aminotransferase [Candidatus Nitrososphaera evergladensis SR1]
MPSSQGEKDLEALRGQIRAVTSDILKKVQERMVLAEQVGEVKSRLGIDVKDEKVEQEIRQMVIKQAGETGMSIEFALRLLNVLLSESEAVQEQKRPQQNNKAPRQTHLGIFQKAKQLEASGRRIIHLEVGEPDYPAPAQAGSALAESFAQKKYHYTDTRGIPQLREAIAKKNRVGEERVMVTPGGRFAVFAAIASLVRPGEEIIAIEPAWPAYRECADFIGARTKVLKTTLESGWTPDLKELESMITSGTKMIALNYPNNPTGKVLDKKTMDRIVALAKGHGLYLLSDEVYSDYSFKPFESVHAYGYDKGVIVSSFSKTYAMTGFRVGYAVASADLIKKMAKVQAVGVTSVAEPVQLAALAALGADPSRNVELMKRRLRFLSGKLKEMSLRFVEPDGAMYVYPELHSGGEDMQLVERLLERGVAIAPGSGFGDSYRRFVRISACRNEKEMEKGLAIMADEVRKAR